MLKKYLIFVIFITIKTTIAYIDPGTTGMIIGGSIWPFIIGIFIVIGTFFIKYFKLIRKGLLKLYEKIKKKD